MTPRTVQNRHYVVVNAFADCAFGGNPAAVFPEARGLDTATMQAYARQLNLVESVFVLPPNNDADFHLRYFTPEGEIPIAGHPTIAAWLALIYREIVKRKSMHYKQCNLAGSQEIEIDCAELSNPIVTMKQPAPKFIENTVPADLVLSTFGLLKEDIDYHLPIQAIDTGLGHLIVPLRSLNALFRVNRQIEPLRNLCRIAGVREAQLFCFETIDQSSQLHTRNLCPREGLEDPACGVGNGALAAYMSRNYWPKKEVITLRIEQGHIVKMPSIIHTKTINERDQLQVFVGGTGKVMLEGQFLC